MTTTHYYDLIPQEFTDFYTSLPASQTEYSLYRLPYILGLYFAGWRTSEIARACSPKNTSQKSPRGWFNDNFSALRDQDLSDFDLPPVPQPSLQSLRPLIHPLVSPHNDIQNEDRYFLTIPDQDLYHMRDLYQDYLSHTRFNRKTNTPHLDCPKFIAMKELTRLSAFYITLGISARYISKHVYNLPKTTTTLRTHLRMIYAWPTHLNPPRDQATFNLIFSQPVSQLYTDLISNLSVTNLERLSQMNYSTYFGTVKHHLNQLSRRKSPQTLFQDHLEKVILYDTPQNPTLLTT